MVSGQTSRRSKEEVAQDVEQIKKHFNHVVAENDMKWQLIHPRAGKDGFDFAPADALIEFAQKNQMEVAGHTLVGTHRLPMGFRRELSSQTRGIPKPTLAPTLRG